MESEGIYLANIIDYEYINNVLNSRKDKSNMIEYMSNLNDKISNFNQNIITYITHNNGGKWNKLKLIQSENKADNEKLNIFDKERPHHDLKQDINQLINEEIKHKYLNIHSSNGIFPRFYSIKSAPGIVIANGNVGNFLSFSSHEVNTYISRDAGIN